MKTFIFLIFLIISITNNTTIESRLDSNEFHEIIDDFVEIFKVANHDEDIALLLTNVKDTLEISENNYKTFLNGFVLSCNTAKNRVANYAKSLKTAADQAKNDANHWKKSAEKAFAGSADNDKMLNQTRLTLNNVLADMAHIIVEYREGVSESESKLIVIKQLNDIIEDELIKPTGKSFVQIKFHTKLNKLQKLVRNSGDAFYTPILTALINLASEQNFSDQKILKQILINLAKLKINIEKFKAEKESTMNQLMTTLKSQEQNLESQIGDFQHLSERYVSTVTEAHQSMDILNTDFTNL